MANLPEEFMVPSIEGYLTDEVSPFGRAILGGYEALAHIAESDELEGLTASQVKIRIAKAYRFGVVVATDACDLRKPRVHMTEGETNV